MKLFGTDGIRGRVNEFPMTAETMLLAGKSIAALLKSMSNNNVLIGKDTRISGDMLESAIASGLTSMGMNVTLLGVVPTPAVARLTSQGAAAGVMITASHNPYEDNGIKIFGANGYKLSDEQEAFVENYILNHKPEPSQEIGRISHLTDAAERYIHFVKEAMAGLSLTGIKIVIDCGNGAAHAIAPTLFTDLGAEVIAINTQPNGTNINAACGALHPEVAAEYVRKHQADLGVSFDGDADRVIFTDANGQVVSGDRALGLCALALKEQGKLQHDTLVATVMSNLGLIEAMAQHGIKVETTAVGDRNVIECMRKHGYTFGGENSGHLIFGSHVTTGDGILSALQVLQMMQTRSASLAELAAMMQEYPTQLVNLTVASKPPLASLRKLQALMQQASTEFGSSGRHLIRYSGTENKIRILVEHRELATVRSWIDRFSTAIYEEIR